MIAPRSESLLHAQFRALQTHLGRQRNPHYDPSAPGAAGQTLTALMKHGGLYSLLDSEMMAGRLAPMLSGVLPTDQVVGCQCCQRCRRQLLLPPDPGQALLDGLQSCLAHQLSG